MDTLASYLTYLAAKVIYRVENLIYLHADKYPHLSAKKLAKLIYAKDSEYMQHQIDKMHRFLLYDAPVTNQHLKFTKAMLAVFPDFIEALLECVLTRLNEKSQVLAFFNAITSSFEDGSAKQNLQQDFKSNQHFSAFMFWYSNVCNKAIALAKERKINVLYKQGKFGKEYQPEYIKKLSRMLEQALTECIADELVPVELSADEKYAILLEIEKVAYGLDKDKIKSIILKIAGNTVLS